MMNINNRISCVLLLLFSLSCTPTSLTTQELADYLGDPTNGAVKSTQIGDLKVDVTYQPSDLLIARELANSKHNHNELTSLKNKFINTDYFLLTLSRNNKEILNASENSIQYSDLLQRLSFQMQNYIRLINSAGDTLPPANFILDRTYGMSGETRLLFAFPKKASSDWKFYIGEFGLQSGNIIFTFSKKDISSIPKLKY